tara:strand:- start:821 stop:1126 length:306 start_codon:yes stop_codon:yes gene_type:complete
MSFDPSAVEFAFNDNVDISCGSIEMSYENFPGESGRPSFFLSVDKIHFLKEITNIEKFSKVSQIVNNLILPYYPIINVARHDYLDDDESFVCFNGSYSKLS